MLWQFDANPKKKSVAVPLFNANLESLLEAFWFNYIDSAILCNYM